MTPKIISVELFKPPKYHDEFWLQINNLSEIQKGYRDYGANFVTERRTETAS